MKYRSRLFNFNRSTPLPKQIYIQYCTTIFDAVSEPSRERFNSLVKKCSRILFRVYALFDSFTGNALCRMLAPFSNLCALASFFSSYFVKYDISQSNYAHFCYLNTSPMINEYTALSVFLRPSSTNTLSLQKTPTSKGQCIQDSLH